MGFDKEASSSSSGLDAAALLPKHGGGGGGVRLSSQPKTFANVFIAVVGSGVLGLPYTFSRTGWAVGSILLLAVAALTFHSMMLLVACRRRLADEHPKIASFGDLGAAVYGAAGRHTVDAMLVLSQASFCVGYLIFIANTLLHPQIEGDGSGGGVPGGAGADEGAAPSPGRGRDVERRLRERVAGARQRATGSV